MTEERFEQVLREHARDYHRPPETPSEAMWREIERRRQGGREAGTAVPPSRRSARLRWVVWAAAAAAVLAVGIGIGRMSVAPETVGPAGVVVAAGDGDGVVSAVAYEFAAAEHLGRVETFLTLFRADAAAGRAPDVRPARPLLISTRLLQQSPAMDNPTLRSVLDDVELVLAQIALYRAGSDDEELRLINQGIERRDVLLKLRSATGDQAERAILQGA